MYDGKAQKPQNEQSQQYHRAAKSGIGASNRYDGGGVGERATEAPIQFVNSTTRASTVSTENSGTNTSSYGSGGNLVGVRDKAVPRATPTMGATATKRVFVGMENERGFSVRAKLVGISGQNIRYIEQMTNSKIQLRGQGSGYIEGTSGTESYEAMYFYIVNNDAQKMQSAERYCLDLIETVKKEYTEFVRGKSMSSSSGTANVKNDTGGIRNSEVVNSNVSSGDVEQHAYPPYGAIQTPGQPNTATQQYNDYYYNYYAGYGNQYNYNQSQNQSQSQNQDYSYGYNYNYNYNYNYGHGYDYNYNSGHPQPPPPPPQLQPQQQLQPQPQQGMVEELVTNKDKGDESNENSDSSSVTGEDAKKESVPISISGLLPTYVSSDPLSILLQGGDSGKSSKEKGDDNDNENAGIEGDNEKRSSDSDSGDGRKVKYVKPFWMV
ncbi:UPF0469 protein [Zancudomyces culisetae]|uniref:UPF0469 protein n=1 Tax=Zancudomyces culisetae TaxID=1213189 RepID=A0A1R1PVC3_ZANCU|nr:UPF0469 protein [Zancudomyces culisetae]|eukprot:OMH84908.1 UPF0469 protein [Zancudomyces culisetae]